MRTIYLVRHCEYDLSHGGLPGRLPVELSDKGLLQATNLQQFFADKEIGKIYSSAVYRCKQTSEIISFGTIPIEYDKRLLETFSAYQGYWYVGEKDREYFYNHHAELGGETYEEVWKRVSDFYKKVASKQDRIIVCSHGDVLFMMYLYILGEKLPVADNFESAMKRFGYQLKGSVRIITFDKNNEFELQKLVQF